MYASLREVLASLPDFGRGGIEEGACLWGISRVVKREKPRLLGVRERHEGSVESWLPVRVRVVREIWGILEATAEVAMRANI